MTDLVLQSETARSNGVERKHPGTTLGGIDRDPAEQEVTLRALFDNTTAGIAEIDAETGRFLTVNRRYCQITGRPAAELLGGLRITDVLHPEEQRVATAVAEAGGDAERRYLRPDGQVAWVRISVAVTARDRCGAARRISAVVQDVTESHAAQEKLKASEAMLRLSLEIGQIGSFSRDLVTGHIQCGEETRLMHGLPAGNTPIPFEAWLATVVPEDRSLLLAALSNSVADRRLNAGYEYRFCHPVSGEIRHIEVRTRYEYDANGRPLLALGAIIDVTARREAEARIRHLAFHDTLTDLPNRAMFRQQLQVALASNAEEGDIAVLYLNLDGFKNVNDTHGHSIGDWLLCEVARRLQDATGPSVSIARLGGDEFALIQRGLQCSADAAAMAKRLLAALHFPFLVNEREIIIATSIGVALVPRDGVAADEILKAADLALYDAKAAGRGCFRFYQQAMSDRIAAHRALEMDLRLAVARGEFVLHYQPILDVETLHPVALEALLRWKHPVRGMVLPDDFIPIAEELGLIVPIGAWALARACADATTWQGNLRVAVNLSAIQVGHRDLVSSVISVLAETGLDPRRLELEITETVMLDDSESNLATLHRFKELGIRIALDDFGTGYSSLNYLRSFPFDKVKIDRSFARDLDRSPQCNVIMQAMLDLCAGLGMTSTVEGVETLDQLRAIAAKQCKEVQGYLFSRPVPGDQVNLLLTSLARDAARHLH